MVKIHIFVLAILLVGCGQVKKFPAPAREHPDHFSISMVSAGLVVVGDVNPFGLPPPERSPFLPSATLEDLSLFADGKAEATHKNPHRVFTGKWKHVELNRIRISPDQLAAYETEFDVDAEKQFLRFRGALPASAPVLFKVGDNAEFRMPQGSFVSAEVLDIRTAVELHGTTAQSVLRRMVPEFHVYSNTIERFKITVRGALLIKMYDSGEIRINRILKATETGFALVDEAGKEVDYEPGVLPDKPAGLLEIDSSSMRRIRAAKKKADNGVMEKAALKDEVEAILRQGKRVGDGA